MSEAKMLPLGSVVILKGNVKKIWRVSGSCSSTWREN